MNIDCRFSPDLGHINLKDAGDGRASSALRDEVCSMCFNFACLDLEGACCFLGFYSQTNMYFLTARYAARRK